MPPCKNYLWRTIISSGNDHGPVPAGNQREPERSKKLHPRETCDERIDRLADAAYDDEPLSPEEIRDIRKSGKDITAVRVRSLQEIMRDPGDDKLIRSQGE